MKVNRFGGALFDLATDAGNGTKQKQGEGQREQPPPRQSMLTHTCTKNEIMS
jgi:hypothetical protein